MITELASLLNMDEEQLMGLIRTAAGDKAQMSIHRQLVDITADGPIRRYEPTGFAVMIATGMDDKFALTHETESDRPGYSQISSATISFR